MAAREPQSRSVAVALHGVCKRYGDTYAVKGIDLAVSPGEFVSLLGSSGSGKTTTLMMIAGFVQPDEGEIRVDDIDVRNVRPHRRDIGIVYQNYGLFPHLSVARNIGFPLEMRGVAKSEIRRRVAEVLRVVHLEGFDARLPQELSGGQQQRVALARAIVFGPSVLLMDEPLGALDANLRVQMQAEIKSLQRKVGITTLYVTHDQTEAMTLSDRVVVMNAGRIEQIGRPEDVYERPANRFVATFMGAPNLIPGTAITAGNQPIVRVEGGATVAATSGRPIAANEKVHVVVRPERLRIVRDDEPALVAARVRESMYVGGARRYDATSIAGERLVVVQTDLNLPVVPNGDEVKLGWDPAFAWVIGADETAPADRSTASGAATSWRSAGS
jgi:spermidine/putrescine ABC transporter ATP-binding subunit